MSNFHVELVRRVQLVDIPARRQATCKHVLGWIAYHASEEEADIAYPGVETLELETGLGNAAISRATELLAAHEWLSKKRRNGTSQIYRLNVRKLREHYVPKPPSTVAKLAAELPGLGFSHESEPGADAAPDPDEPDAHTGENSYPQGPDQQICSHDTSAVFSRHDGDVVTTRPPCSHDTQTIREPSETHQPTTGAAGEPDGWLAEGSAEDTEETDNGVEAEPGYRLLAELGVNGRPRREWAETVTLAGELFGADAVHTQLIGGASRPGPGAIVTTRLPGLAQQIEQAQQAPARESSVSSAATSTAWPTWCGACDREVRRYETAAGAVAKCPDCHPDAMRSTAADDARVLDTLAGQAE